MDISLSNAIIAEAQQGGLPAGDLPAAAERVLQPLLGGENVRVVETLTGDLQRLLAQVRAEQDEKKLQLLLVFKASQNRRGEKALCLDS